MLIRIDLLSRQLWKFCLIASIHVWYLLVESWSVALSSMNFLWLNYFPMLQLNWYF